MKKSEALIEHQKLAESPLTNEFIFSSNAMLEEMASANDRFCSAQLLLMLSIIKHRKCSQSHIKRRGRFEHHGRHGRLEGPADGLDDLNGIESLDCLAVLDGVELF